MKITTTKQRKALDRLTAKYHHRYATDRTLAELWSEMRAILKR